MVEEIGRRAMRRSTRHPIPFCLATALALVSGRQARADERVTYLIETLEESLNYRIRVQTIESLDQIAVTASGEDLARIVQVVSDTLDDSNALVRYAAASTLIGLGRSSLRSTDLPGVISAIEALASDPDQDVKDLVSGGLSDLRQRLAQLQAAVGTGGDGGAGEAGDAPPRFYVAVGTLGDSSGSGREDAASLARQCLLDALDAVPGVEPHGDVPTGQAFRTELERRQLQGFVLQGSVVELRRDGNSIAATVSVLVLDHEQNLRVMLRGQGNAVRRSGTLADAEVPAAQADALRAAVGAAVGSLAGYLRSL